MGTILKKLLVTFMVATLVACGSGGGSGGGASSANTKLKDVEMPADVTLDQPFDSNVSNYTGSVANDVTSFSMTPSVEDPNSVITINGMAAEAGRASPAVPLNVGENIITMVVTAPDGSTQRTYTFVVTRAANLNANLAGLSLTSGNLDQTFSANVNDYSATVPNSVSSISVIPTAEANSSTIIVNGVPVNSGQASAAIPLYVGSNAVSVVVTAEDQQTQQTYRLVVTRTDINGGPGGSSGGSGTGSSDANLSSLSVNRGALSPGFSPAILSYNVAVPNEVTSLSLVPIASDSANAIITVDGVSVTSGSSVSAALSVGSNSIAVQVQAENGALKTYTIAVTRQPKTNANLANITVSAGSLNPSFSSGVTAYAVDVANSQTSIDLSAVVADSTASVKINGTAVASGSALTMNLSEGSNLATIEVTAQDGTTVKTYNVVVTRATAGGGSVDLSDLSLSIGAMDQTFSAGTINYTKTVSNATTSLTVTPTVADATSTVKVNNVSVTSGNASGAISLSAGDNIISVVVTSQDGQSNKTYTITVTRQSAANANLSGLSASTGAFNVAFDPATLAYTQTVANGISSMTVTPTSEVGTSTITVNGSSVASGNASNTINLSVGNNIINVVVTAQDSVTTKTYTLTVTRQGANNADLADLAVSTGALNEAFASGTTSYTQTVSSSFSSVTVTPTLADTNATVTVNSVSVTSGFASGVINLNAGANAINVLVTAEDGSTQKNYLITITRQPANNADLSALSLSSGTLSPAFDAATNSYTASVSNATNSVTVTATAADANYSAMTIKAAAATSGVGLAISLNEGDNSIPVVVTAEDGSTQNTYNLTVHRIASDAKLSALSLSSGTLSPVFASGTTAYSASVSNATASITVTATANDTNYSAMTINGVGATSAVASGAIALNVGANVIPVVVTAEDGTTQMTYNVTVTRSSAVTKTVCNSGCNYITIQGAIDAVAAGTIIEVSDGTYAESITIGSKNVTVTSLNGAASTFITGDGTDKPVVTFNGADTAVLDGFTIDNTFANGVNSRGIYITASNTPTISNTIITDNSLVGDGTSLGAGIKLLSNTGTTVLDGVSVTNNSTKWGSGGIHLDGSSLSIIGTTHIDNNNVSQGPGGGIRVANNSSLSIDASGISTSSINSNNAVGNGAGILFEGSAGGSLSIKDITINGNTNLAHYGAGIYLDTLSTTTNLTNVAITSNTTKYGGGGIYAKASDVNIINSDISGNQVNQGHGGGINLINGSSAVITNTTVNSNLTNSNGIGLYMLGGGTATLSISGSTFNDNGPVSGSSGYGGGIHLENVAGTTSIVDTTINGNSVKWGGGGLYANNGAVVDLVNVELSNNSLTQGSGGGIKLQGGTAGSTLTNVVIKGNTATNGNGGGAFFTESVTVDRAIIQGNKTTTDGGGVYAGADFVMTNSLITGNAITTTGCCGRDGGGIHLGGVGSTNTLTNVTVAGNSAQDTAGIHVQEPDATLTVNNSILYSNVATTTGDGDDQLNNVGTVTLNYSVIKDGWGGAGTGNVSAKPAFVDEQSASGATPTTAGDFRLCTDSFTPDMSCPDAGVGYPSIGIDFVPAASAPQTVDVLGNLRASDIPGAGSDGADYYDAGAYEYQSGTDNFTIIEQMSVVRDTETTIAVSMGYSGDANGDNTYTVDYKLTSETAWTNHVTAATHVVNPYTTSITGLTAGEAYDVRLTYNDTDGVGGDNGTIFRGVEADADLTALSLNIGTLSPTFNVDTTSYTATVPYANSSINVTGVLSDSSASMTIGGQAATSGIAKSVALNVGANAIDVVVTAAGSSVTKTYTITVTRSAASTDADLSALSLSTGSLSPAFASGTTSYTATVSYATASITMTATANDALYSGLTIDAVSESSGVASGAIALSVGANPIDVVVTAEDGTTTKTYTVTVTRSSASTNADLSNLTLSVGSLTPGFASGTTSYTATVPYATASITMTATVADTTYSGMTIDAVGATSGVASGAIALSVGANPVDVVVTAEDGTTTNTYTVTVTRSAASTDANLSGLSLSSGTLSPAFASGTLSYTATVSNATASITVTATANDANYSALTVDAVSETSGVASNPVALSVGANPIDIVVTAEDGSTQKTYQVVVTRQAAAGSDADLIGLVPSTGALDQTFQASSTSYTMTVGYVIQNMQVTPTLSDPLATMTVNGQAVADGALSQAIALTTMMMGTDINIVVTAQDTVTTKTYTINVTRQNIADFAQQAYVKASNTGATDHFGNAVDISGDWMVVAARYEDGSITSDGATFDNNSTSNAGGVYVFKRTGATWAQQAYLKPEQFSEANNYFGWDVAIDGDTILVGMPGHDNWAYTGVFNAGDADYVNAQTANWNDMNTGAVFVFRDTSGDGSGTWAQEAFIVPSFLDQAYGFGRALDIDGDTIIVGSHGDDNSTTGVQNTSGVPTTNDSAIDSGAAWIYVRSGTTWSQEAYLKPTSFGAANYMGSSVAIDGDTAVYTAAADSAGGTRAGAAHVFVRSGSTWSYQQKLVEDTPVAEDRMGGCRFDTADPNVAPCFHHVGISGDTIVVGVLLDDTTVADSGGAAIFTRSGAVWTQEALLKGSNAGNGDLISGVSIEGDTVVMASVHEDSSTTGINSTADNAAADAGAAYVFTRSGTTWTERYYIKSSNPTANDAFGIGGCDISGDTIACATWLEDGSGTGIDPADDNAAGASGAVYIFQ